MEKEAHKRLPFLDVECEIEGDHFVTKVYHKGTYTGLFMNFYSFAPSTYKNGLVKTLIDRLYQISNTWKGFDHDVVKLKATLGKNEYPGKLIDNQIHKYLDNKDNTKVEIDESEKKIKYFKLPFIGSMSLYTQKKLNDIIKRFCKVENVKLVFTTCKLSSFFSLKDRVPFELQSFVVYKFVCNGCSAMYVGMTCSHLSTRIKQHLVTDKNSYI